VVSLIVFLFFYIKNKFHGFLGFDNTDKARVWSEDEVKILQTLARNIHPLLKVFLRMTFLKVRKFRLLAIIYLGRSIYLKMTATTQNYILMTKSKKLTGYAKSEF
jgi:hypothetical protein